MSAPGLSRIGALRELGDAQLEQLLDFVEERTLERGMALFYAGDESRELFWLAEGRIALAREGRPEGSLEAGATIGALSLAAVGARACEARAEVRSRVYVLDREAYLRMRSDAPELALCVQESVVRVLAEDLRALLASPGGAAGSVA